MQGFGNDSHYTVGEHGVADLGAQVGKGDAFECLGPSVKMPHTVDFKKIEIDFLTVLELGSPKSSCGWGWLLRGHCPCVQKAAFLLCVLGPHI